MIRDAYSGVSKVEKRKCVVRLLKFGLNVQVGCCGGGGGWL